MSLLELPPLSLYIHLPWCERKCPYCDFNSHDAAAALPEQSYVDTLLADLQADLVFVAGRPINTIFIGGGTPSLFSVAAIERLMRGIAERVELSVGFEATMEANPGSAEAEKFQGYREAGINRISLGVQSFQDEQLQALGRVHNSDEAHSAIEKILAAGLDNFNIDLMHGLPGQSVLGAAADLKAGLAYSPAHLSWYQLTIEPNTVFHNRPPVLPVEDALADIQDEGARLLSEQGYNQYEVSAFARQNSRCRHNENYWSFGDYLGVGAGAHSKISQLNGPVTRYSKRRQPTQYMTAKASDYIATRRELTPADLIGEYMLNALRLNHGFTVEQFSARTGLAIESIESRIESLKERNLLLSDPDGVCTTMLGRQFLDDVVGEFF
jgi:putative oxygen-independent coproporphyrinogen III oxidase